MLKKIDAPAQPDPTGIVADLRYVTEGAAVYAVFDLRGHRLGAINASFATEAESLKKAGFGKGVYMLRAKNGMVHRVMVTK